MTDATTNTQDLFDFERMLAFEAASAWIVAFVSAKALVRRA